jgi:hypothetical protein
MGYRKLRLRVLTLLVAFGLGLLGQAVATAAVAMPTPTRSDDLAASSGSMAGADGCPACPKETVPGSPAMALCAMTLCAGLPAVLAAGPIAAPFARGTFPPIVVDDKTGRTIRPDLGPPKTIGHS